MQKKIKYFIYSLIILLTFAIGNSIYADISVEDLKKEYTNEQSQFIEVDESMYISEMKVKAFQLF